MNSKMESKKICFILATLDAGGVENRLLRYLRFMGDNANITVIVKSGRKSDLYDAFLATGCRIRFQGIGYFNLPRIWALYRFFRAEKFDTVCDFCGNFAGISLSVARWAGIASRLAFFARSSHAFRLTRFNLWYARLSNWLIFSNATKILSNSNTALDFFFPYRKAGDTRFRVLPNAVDTAVAKSALSREAARSKYGIPEKAFVIGHIGRFDPAKNHTTFLRVAAQLSARIGDVIFVVCGKGTDSDAFQTEVANAGLTERLYMLGTRTDIGNVLRTFDLFYFPSVTEGQPNALIEAAMAGVPVIASDIPSIKEIIPPENHRFLVSPTDHESASLLIASLYENRESLNELVYRDLMMNRFDPETNFRLFTDQL